VLAQSSWGTVQQNNVHMMCCVSLQELLSIKHMLPAGVFNDASVHAMYMARATCVRIPHYAW